jgi:hypothetical protein
LLLLLETRHVVRLYLFLNVAQQMLLKWSNTRQRNPPRNQSGRNNFQQFNVFIIEAYIQIKTKNPWLGSQKKVVDRQKSSASLLLQLKQPDTIISGSSTYCRIETVVVVEKEGHVQWSVFELV